jgi:hypothetical protein
MSAKRELFAGETFAQWTILDPTSIMRKGSRLVVCQCVCGTTKAVHVTHLIHNRSTACRSCATKEAARHRDNTAYAHLRPPSSLRHGHAGGGRSLTYRSWQAMLARCENTKNIGWQRYGGKGIAVCERWHTFEHFLTDMGERPGKGYTLDRHDNTKGYEPTNCRWATWKQQNRNTSRNRLYTFQGATHPLCTWAEIAGLAWQCLRWRLDHGWTIERSLTTPSGKKESHQITSALTAKF